MIWRKSTIRVKCAKWETAGGRFGENQTEHELGHECWLPTSLLSIAFISSKQKSYRTCIMCPACNNYLINRHIISYISVEHNNKDFKVWKTVVIGMIRKNALKPQLFECGSCYFSKIFPKFRSQFNSLLLKLKTRQRRQVIRLFTFILAYTLSLNKYFHMYCFYYP